MERNFDISNFEESLRQHADDFLMTPSNRVWKGIYNDLHPGSKWPSITIALFFLMSLIGIGYWNLSSQSPKATNNNLKEKNTSTAYPDGSSDFSALQPKDVTTSAAEVAMVTASGSKSFLSLSKEQDNYMSLVDENMISAPPLVSSRLISGNFITAPRTSFINDIPVGASVMSINKGSSSAYAEEPARNTEKVTNREHLAIRSLKMTSLNGKNSNAAQDAERNEKVVATTQKITKKKNKGTEWTFYLTPAISTVYFKGKPVEYSQPVTGSSPILLAPANVGNTLRINARIGLAAGTRLKVNLSEKTRFLSGLEISSSGYNILANRVHPTFAYLVLRERDGQFAPHKYMTFYGNGNGEDEISLPNSSMEISLPLGLERSVWKNDHLEIGIAATIAPAFLISNNGYILSADGRNFVSDADLMRMTNVNAQIESFISFYSNDVKWRIGPTFNYQMLSTYKNIYPVKEHLLDYGIRIGISKRQN